MAATLAAFFALSAIASATVYSGSTHDASGDGPSGGQDITGVEASYDSVDGLVEFRVSLAAAPTGNFQVTTALGRLSGGQCNAPLVILGTILPDGAAIWLLDRDGTNPAEEQDQATRSVSGQVVTLKAGDSRLRGLQPDCAVTILSDPDDTATIYDEVGTFAVKPPPPKPQLSAKVSRIGGLKRGATKPVKVTVKNVGKAAARGVVVKAKVKGTAGLSPRTRKLGSIPAGKSKTARFRVKVSRRGKGTVTISARATGRKVKAAASTSFRVKVPQPPPPPSTGGLAGNIFWGFENYQYDRSSDVVFLDFTSRNLVRWGIPKHGLTNCRRPTAKIKDGEMQPGCLRYSYNKRSGAVRIGKVRGTFKRGKLKLKMDSDVWSTDGKSWYGAVVPKRGARFKTSLINRGYYGACGITPYCSTWSEYLILTRDGRFGRTKSSLTTGGYPGGFFTAISSLGPDEKGSYKVMAGGRIRFNYADGHKTTETLVVQTDKRGRPDPVKEGLLVGDLWFYKDE